MCEIWKDIKGYEGLYQVSNLGRVKSLDRVVEYKDGKKCLYKSKLLIGTDNGRGYLIVNLRKNGARKSFLIHRLVAEAFVPNPDNKLTVDHMNRNRADNRMDNLRWATRLEQADNTDNKKPIVAIKGETILYFESAKQTEKYGFVPSAICNCCRGKKKTHRGYEWHYLGNWLDKQAPDTPAPYILARNIPVSLR